VRSPPAAALDYSLITTREGFDGLAAAWEELFQRSGRGAQAFQTFGWCWQWCNHYLADKDTLAVVAGWRGSELVLVWPLVARRTAGVLKLTSLGAPVSQYSDALIEPSADVEAQIEKAWDFVVGAVKPDLVWLSHVRADAAIAPLMEQLGAIETQRLEAPYIDLSKTPNVDTFMRRYSSHTRKKYRAAGRRIADVGRFVELSEGTGARQLAASVIEMKRRQLRERGLLSPAFADNRMRDFFADAASGQGYPTGTRIQALQIGEECAAADIVLTCKQTVLGHVFTYDPRFAKDNVGLQLLHHIIDGLIGDGYQTFDLLAPADVYKLRCADGTLAVVDWAIPLTSKGRLLARAQKVARSAAKAALRWLPEEPRRYLAQRYYRRVS
jgi:CelD/BcsL family acetyltransferase involved in cellulose biosynthesis